MRSRNAGKICDRLWYLGREESGIYLLEGDRCSLIISGGLSYLAPVVLSQLNAFGIDEKKIGKLLILHAHFDHVGLVPLFKRRNPEIDVYASARAWEILNMPKGIETINAFSRLVADRMGLTGCLTGQDLEWRNDITGRVVSEGAEIDLGGISVQILETPGHSSCSISAYVHEINALFPSDGGGIPYAEMIIPSGNSNFTQHQESLEKLKPLKVDILCADHYGYVTGREAEGYICRSIAAARENRTQIEALYRRTGSIDETVTELVEEVYRQQPDYLLSPEICAGICRQTVRHIAGALEESA
ncbi:MAG: MBL fold metallo-hydrolase [Pseudomonadota bacterium]|nr:MBL fold metallo-hydrolase [Pseudomonadota bacterium]MBU1183855.1 MBL fold metallo-hydrolase [Pseudomonadota bacterium]MBU4120421.1 MBL fold metallo-hydrolase [Pseudomonadota bacterium]